MATKFGMYLATHESVTVPVGRDRKILTGLRTNQIAGFITVPSEKKIITFIYITYAVTGKLNNGTFIHLMSEFSQTICS